MMRGWLSSWVSWSVEFLRPNLPDLQKGKGSEADTPKPLY